MTQDVSNLLLKRLFVPSLSVEADKPLPGKEVGLNDSLALGPHIAAGQALDRCRQHRRLAAPRQ